MNFRSKLLSLLALVLCCGCSTTNQAYVDSLIIAMKANKDVQIDLQAVKKSRADLVNVRLGDNPSVIMALAFIENGSHKWVSVNKSMLVLSNDILIETNALSSDLVYTSARPQQSLKSLAKSNTLWHRTIDTSELYGIHLTSSWVESMPLDVLTVLDQQIETDVVEELVSVSNLALPPGIPNSWTNQYWIAKDTGQVVKTSQYLVSINDNVEFVFLSRIARLSENEEIEQSN